MDVVSTQPVNPCQLHPTSHDPTQNSNAGKIF